MALKQCYGITEGGKSNVRLTAGKNKVLGKLSERESLWVSKKLSTTQSCEIRWKVTTHERQRDWGAKKLTTDPQGRTFIVQEGARMEHNQVTEHSSVVLSHKKHTLQKSEWRCRFKNVDLFQKLNTTHLGQRNYKWTAPKYSNWNQYWLYSDFLNSMWL